MPTSAHINYGGVGMNGGLAIDHLFIISLTGIMLFISCKKELLCENCKVNNKAPIAHSGRDTTIALLKDSTSG